MNAERRALLVHFLDRPLPACRGSGRPGFRPAAFSAALVALLGVLTDCASTARRPAPTGGEAGTAFPPGAASPTEEQLRPLWASLLLMRDGMVYRVGKPADPRLLRSDRDSTGHVAGCPILEAGAVGRNEDWLVSFKSILAKPSHYTLAGSSRMFPPDHVVRLYGEGDTITVMTALDKQLFWIHLFSSRTATTGSLGADVDSMRALMQAALRPPKR